MKYNGGCHCGKVRFEVELTLDKALSCNCSICLKRGSLLAFTPEENFKLLSGEEDLTDYLFNKKVIHHCFCATCGILPFGKGKMPDGKPVRAINIRCLDNVNIEEIKIDKIDGRSF